MNGLVATCPRIAPAVVIVSFRFRRRRRRRRSACCHLAVSVYARGTHVTSRQRSYTCFDRSSRFRLIYIRFTRRSIRLVTSITKHCCVRTLRNVIGFDPNCTVQKTRNNGISGYVFWTSGLWWLPEERFRRPYRPSLRSRLTLALTIRPRFTVYSECLFRLHRQSNHLQD